MRQLVRIPAGPINLEGTLDVPENPLGIILFVHGSGSSRLSPRNHVVAEILHRSGMATLLMDLLTAAENVDFHRRFDIRLLARRLDGCIDWVLHQRMTHALPIGLFGASTGAAAALHVAALRGAEVSAVVSRGGRPDLADKPSLNAVASPTLLIAGGEDKVVINLNRHAFAELRCDKELEIISGATHLFEEPGKLEQVATLARDWFLHYLCPPHARASVRVLRRTGRGRVMSERFRMQPGKE